MNQVSDLMNEQNGWTDRLIDKWRCVSWDGMVDGWMNGFIHWLIGSFIQYPLTSLKFENAKNYTLKYYLQLYGAKPTRYKYCNHFF